MDKYALTGHPLGHSMSPLIHEKLFALSGNNDAEYSLIDISPDDIPESRSIFEKLCGLNVTIPHKQSVIRLMDRLDDTAARYSAVNCIKNDGGTLIGYNTDCEGFLRSAEGLPINGKTIILGCGGVGRMIAIESALHGADITLAVLPRSIKKAQLLMAEILEKCGGASVKIADISSIDEKSDILINATPIGMYPNTEECPVSEKLIEKTSCVFDVIYNPTETLFMKKAEAMGKTAVGGTAMLVYQAVKAHEIWYGGSFSADDISNLIKDVENAVNYMNNN